MFGSNYYRYLDILWNSFEGMTKQYKGKSKQMGKTKINKFVSKEIIETLQKLYIRLFGIPEIGFQVRSLYFQHAIDATFRKKTFTKILDVGCGIGVYTFHLGNLYPDAHVVGSEIDKTKLAFCKKIKEEMQVNNVSFFLNNIEKKNLGKEKYDLITIIDVLEHIRDYKKVLKNLNSLLKPKGYLFIHVPQAHQRRFFKQLKDWEHSDHKHEGLTASKFEGELKRLGFKVILRKHTFGFFGSLAWELNHILLSKSFILLGLLYPFLYILALQDVMMENKKGLGLALLVQKAH